jgi:arylsulfatase A-like enzyme
MFSILSKLCCALAMAVWIPWASGEGIRPNIVIIMADDLGYGDISPYGGWIDTPHLDALAAGGLRFTDFHSNGNVCSPTRAALMTGRYQQRSGLSEVVYANTQRAEYYHGIHGVEWTLAEAFRDEGYTTAIFGKWHLGYHAPFNPVRHGFDYFRGFVSGNIDYQSHIDAQGREDWWLNDALADEPGYLTDLITKHARSFIAEHKDSPFMLYLPHHAPHYPFQGPDDPAERTVNGEFVHIGAEPDKKRAYREMVESMDQSIGQVVEALEKYGLRDNTLIWFMSDNGAAQWGSNGTLNGFKGSNWEGGHRVPSIVNWPGEINAGTTDALAGSMDVMPTVLNIAGRNKAPERPFDGVDLSGVLFDSKSLHDRTMFWKRGVSDRNHGAMRDGQWKLLIPRAKNPSGTPKLFDLRFDLGENNDLAKRYPKRTETMKVKLATWTEDVSSTATPQPEKPATE